MGQQGFSLGLQQQRKFCYLHSETQSVKRLLLAESATSGGTQNITPTATGTYTYIIAATGNGVTVYSSATLIVQ